jgi:Glycogen recognition site of AMP-activated protein kinase
MHKLHQPILQKVSVYQLKKILKLKQIRFLINWSKSGEAFTQTYNPIKMKKENGYWTCDVTLPKGEVIYKFIVNNQYYADSKNYMYVGTGPKIYSKLYVW